MKLRRALFVGTLFAIFSVIGPKYAAASPVVSSHSGQSKLLRNVLHFAHFALVTDDMVVVHCVITTEQPMYSPTIEYTCCPPPDVPGECRDFSRRHAFLPAPQPDQSTVTYQCDAYTTWDESTYTLTYVDLGCQTIGVSPPGQGGVADVP
jgi:hypothetical protein